MYVFICEDQFRRNLYRCLRRLRKPSWSSKYPAVRPENRKISNFFQSTFTRHTVRYKTGKVIRTITSRFGMQFYESIYQAVMSGETHTDKKSIKQTRSIKQSFSRSPAETDSRCSFRSESHASTAFLSFCRATNQEAHSHLEFLRFSELENGVLFAAIHPKDNVLPYIAEHFTDRLPSENFMIYDETHRTVAVHKAYKQYRSQMRRTSIWIK